jgi:hypothetical protein
MASSKISRTQAQNSTTKVTISAWVKRGSLGGDSGQTICASFYSTGYYGVLRFDNSDRLAFRDYRGSNIMILETNAVFRDTSAWYHVVVAVDTTQGTEANRIKIYINGVQETSFATASYPSLNFDTYFNSTVAHYIGSSHNTYFDGYIAETVIIDGLQLTPTSFGEFDEDSGIWKPINVSGLTLGTNGCYLDFEDSSALGNDAAGSNNFTANNLAATDQMTDTCTNNFATMNPLNNHIQNQTFSQGNLQTLSDNPAPATSTIGLTSGKWWIEAKGVSSGSGSDYQIGIVSNQVIANEDIGHYSNNYSYYYNGKLKTGNVQSSYGNTYTHGDIIGVALNLDDNELQFYKNGTVQNSGTAISITAPASTELGAYFFALGADANATKYTLHTNFGSPHFAISSGNADGDGFGNFEYAVPSGFFALCTKNLAEYG